jgi:hypothetical protein
VRNEVLRRVKEQRNILHTIKRRNTDWICYLLHRNCVLKHVIEGRKDRSDGRTRKKTLKQLLVELTDKREY